MAKRILSLHDVPEDEANDIRKILKQAGVAYFETPPGPLGVTPGALWIKNDSDQAAVKAMLAHYHNERAFAAQTDYQLAKARGEIPGFWRTLWRRPFLSLLVIIGILVVLFVVLLPFLLIAP